jgi:hypothetical protein
MNTRKRLAGLTLALGLLGGWMIDAPLAVAHGGGRNGGGDHGGGHGGGTHQPDNDWRTNGHGPNRKHFKINQTRSTNETGRHPKVTASSKLAGSG